MPLIFIGQVVVNPHDNLDGGVVFDHIISEIYKGNLESISYFLSGEIKWFYIEELFYPLNILHYVLNDKLFTVHDRIFIRVSVANCNTLSIYFYSADLHHRLQPNDMMFFPIIV